jgi:hypothetical protein
MLLEASRVGWCQDSYCAVTMLQNSRYYFKNPRDNLLCNDGANNGALEK